MAATVYTLGEIEAHRILNNEITTIVLRTNGRDPIKEAAERIILLAERIKTERSAIQMDMLANLKS